MSKMKRHLEKLEEALEAEVETAYHAGKVPIECIQEHELPDGYIVRTVNFHEC